jgi:hypothetical protein
MRLQAQRWRASSEPTLGIQHSKPAPKELGRSDSLSYPRLLGRRLFARPQSGLFEDRKARDFGYITSQPMIAPTLVVSISA